MTRNYHHLGRAKESAEGTAVPLSIESLGLPVLIEQRLKSHDIETINSLVALRWRDISMMDGIQPNHIAFLKKHLSERGLNLGEGLHEFYQRFYYAREITNLCTWLEFRQEKMEEKLDRLAAEIRSIKSKKRRKPIKRKKPTRTRKPIKRKKPTRTRKPKMNRDKL